MAKAKGERVMLHVYEPAKSGPSVPGFGVYHTGVEIGDSGIEWCYAGGPEASGSGVQQQAAKQTPDASQWRYKESIDLGRTSKTSQQASAVIASMSSSPQWAARDYDVIHHNCNHFTAAVYSALECSNKYPSHINRAATWGGFFLDNPVKDRQRKAAERAAEDERKRNVFSNTTAHSLVNKDKTTNSAALSTVNGSPVGGTTPTQAPAGRGGARPNPWADPNFFPGGGGKKPTAAPQQQQQSQQAQTAKK